LEKWSAGAGRFTFAPLMTALAADLMVSFEIRGRFYIRSFEKRFRTIKTGQIE
jgi:hypothetical protein